MRLFQKGIDENAFAQLVKEYEQKVYNIALFTIQDVVQADDITQEVFIKIYRKIYDYRGDAKLSSWIYRITKNTCYSHLKKEKKYNEMEEIPLEHSDHTTPESQFLQNEKHTRVKHAVGTLSDEQRMAISLFYFHDQSYVEIANIMNLPLNTIKSHIHRAKQTLKKIITNEKNHE